MRLNGATVLGVLLIIAGAIGLIVRGFEYTRKEKVVDIGPIEATADQEEHVSIPIWVSGLVLGAGVVIAVAGARRST